MSLREYFFRAIAEVYLADQDLPLQPDACPDQDVRIVEDVVQAREFFRQAVGPRTDRHRVILILESPHRAEFTPPIGPAKGPTGVNIRRHILHVAGLADVGQFQLVLMNAVQYQCSLGAEHIDGRRAKIFTRIWELGAEQDFQDRLSRYFREGDRIVNCCTAVNAPGGRALRELVQNAIQDCLPGQPILRRFHPARWNIPAQLAGAW
jgi:hypothetical protein